MDEKLYCSYGRFNDRMTIETLTINVADLAIADDPNVDLRVLANEAMRKACQAKGYLSLGIVENYTYYGNISIVN